MKLLLIEDKAWHGKEAWPCFLEVSSKGGSDWHKGFLHLWKPSPTADSDLVRCVRIPGRCGLQRFIQAALKRSTVSKAGSTVASVGLLAVTAPYPRGAPKPKGAPISKGVPHSWQTSTPSRAPHPQHASIPNWTLRSKVASHSWHPSSPKGDSLPWHANGAPHSMGFLRAILDCRTIRLGNWSSHNALLGAAGKGWAWEGEDNWRGVHHSSRVPTGRNTGLKASAAGVRLCACHLTGGQALRADVHHSSWGVQL